MGRTSRLGFVESMLPCLGVHHVKVFILGQRVCVTVVCAAVSAAVGAAVLGGGCVDR
jgi:hypothetical protein